MAILRGNNTKLIDGNQWALWEYVDINVPNKIDIGICNRKSLAHITNKGIDKIATLIILILVSCFIVQNPHLIVSEFQRLLLLKDRCMEF